MKKFYIYIENFLIEAEAAVDLTKAGDLLLLLPSMTGGVIHSKFLTTRILDSIVRQTDGLDDKHFDVTRSTDFIASTTT